MRTPVQKPVASDGATPSRRRSERGAVLVHVAIAFIGLAAFSSFVVDYGILWTARRQAQNAADAAALAAAASLGFGDADNQARARTAALEAAAKNLVWNEPANVTPSDVAFIPCPDGSLEPGGGMCVRVDVFRNQERGNPLPAILGMLVGITDQGVRATATAEVVFANEASCVKPMAILDRWIEAQSGPWDTGDTFDRYDPPPAPIGTLLANPDTYVGPTAGNNGSGLDLTENYGDELTLARRLGADPDSTSWFFPIQLDCPGNTPGSIECFTSNVRTCSPQVVASGNVIQAHAGGFVDAGGVNQLAVALADVMAADASAAWDAGANGGRGGVAGGCMSSGACSVSPRIIALPAIDPDPWTYEGTYSTPVGEHTSVNVTRIVGLFIEQVTFTEVRGRLMPYPVVPAVTTLGVPGQAFVVSTVLVR